MDKIPYIVHESDMARLERTIRRLWIFCIILLAVLIASNVAWFAYELTYETVQVTQENANGYNNFIGNDGVITYGETNGQIQT